MAKRKTRKLRLRFIPLIALAMLIAGFLVRRTLAPMVKFRLTHRPATSRTSDDSESRNSTSSDSTASHGSEDISDSERRQLNGIIRDRSR